MRGINDVRGEVEIWHLIQKGPCSRCSGMIREPLEIAPAIVQNLHYTF